MGSAQHHIMPHTLHFDLAYNKEERNRCLLLYSCVDCTPLTTYQLISLVHRDCPLSLKE